jgi:lipoprotein-anchoring transpeptidase ErfK/SrfK
MRRVLALVVALLALSAACASEDEEPEFSAPPGTTAPTAGTGTTVPEGDGTQLVAEVDSGEVGVWASPADAEEPTRTLSASEEAAGRLVLLVKQQLGASWVEVWLPTAPAGETGWVRRDDVAISRHRFRIDVSRSAHTLTVYAGDVNVLQTPVAIGADAPPEQSDGLYIKDLIETPNPSGRYGRYAYGLAGSDNVAAAFDAGAGVVAIHGTNDESSLGSDVSSGSLAIGSDALDRLVGSIGLPLGTPVRMLP